MLFLDTSSGKLSFYLSSPIKMHVIKGLQSSSCHKTTNKK